MQTISPIATPLREQHGNVLGLQYIQLNMRAVKITAIKGRSGSDRSTSVPRLNRMVEPASDCIEVDGGDTTMYFTASISACGNCDDRPGRTGVLLC